jgi:hypothetical protein
MLQVDLLVSRVQLLSCLITFYVSSTQRCVFHRRHESCENCRSPSGANLPPLAGTQQRRPKDATMTNGIGSPPARRAYAFMESIFRESPAARRYSALAVGPCPNPDCGAAVGEECRGRACPERVAEAVRLLRAGELPELPQGADVPHEPAGPCPDCAAAPRTSRGHEGACYRPSHRCQRQLPAGQCKRSVIPGTRWCPGHGAAKRWADNALRG